MGRRKKMLVSIVAGILLIGLYCMIFLFSQQDGEESSSLSTAVAEKCVVVYNTLAGKNWSGAMMKSMTEAFEHPVRKAAHFGEYAVMGVLVYLLWRPWKQRGKGLYFLVVIWVFFSAVSDELHQLFVPGRYGNPLDVLLDTLGGSTGLFLLVWAEEAVGRLRRRLS